MGYSSYFEDIMNRFLADVHSIESNLSYDNCAIPDDHRGRLEKMLDSLRQNLMPWWTL